MTPKIVFMAALYSRGGHQIFALRFLLLMVALCNRLCTRPCTGHVHGPSVTRSRPCTRNTAVFTAGVHGIVLTVYTAVHGVYGPCTPACTGYTYTVVYPVPGRVYSPRTRPVNGRVTHGLYTAVNGCVGLEGNGRVHGW